MCQKFTYHRDLTSWNPFSQHKLPIRDIQTAGRVRMPDIRRSLQRYPCC